MGLLMLKVRNVLNYFSQLRSLGSNSASHKEHIVKSEFRFNPAKM